MGWSSVPRTPVQSLRVGGRTVEGFIAEDLRAMDACVLEIPELHRAPEGWGEGGGGEGGVWEIAGEIAGVQRVLARTR